MLLSSLVVSRSPFLIYIPMNTIQALSYRFFCNKTRLLSVRRDMCSNLLSNRIPEHIFLLVWSLLLQVNKDFALRVRSYIYSRQELGVKRIIYDYSIDETGLSIEGSVVDRRRVYWWLRARTLGMGLIWVERKEGRSDLFS